MSKTENKDGAQSAPPKGMWESFLDEIGPEPEGILEGLIASIGRPGVNPGMKKAGALIYIMLFVVCILLLLLVGPSIHVFIMFVLCFGLAASLAWFMSELEAEKKRQAEEEKEIETEKKKEK
eukprot:m.43303 g.43303  ORF g.43303 m.43303 type:complete len:122 (+) comp9964_c0_seq4:77-442(+)